jgi:hypothetical protein
MRSYAMNAKWDGRLGAILTVYLAIAGCRGPSTEPAELGGQMQREMRLATPTVGGPSEEFSVEKKPADVATVVERALKDSGVRLVQTGSTAQGQWLLGKSLADRNVLVQILPIYPGRSTAKITVEGADALARELLSHLSADIGKRVR